MAGQLGHGDRVLTGMISVLGSVFREKWSMFREKRLFFMPWEDRKTQESIMLALDLGLQLPEL